MKASLIRSYLEIIMELLLRSCFVIREHFGELVVAQAAPGGDHLHTCHDPRLVRLSEVLLARGAHVLPELPDGEDDIRLLEEHEGLHIQVEELSKVLGALVNLRVGVVQSLLDVEVKIGN